MNARAAMAGDARPLEPGGSVDRSRDFWLSCGHHLLDRDARGQLVVTDDFLKAYLARPEVVPPASACEAEHALHGQLLRSPRMPVEASRIEALADTDARENWQILLAWRDHLLRHPTLEAAYLSLVRESLSFPSLFVDQVVQLLLRNLLSGCEDAFVLRAAELFFRPQKLASHEGSLLAADIETFSDGARPTLLDLLRPPQIEVLGPDNAAAYWERSDAFDLALDLTAGRRGLAALGEVVRGWVRHLLGIELLIEPLTELREAPLTWYVGMEASGTQIGDALWRGEHLPAAVQARVVGLYQAQPGGDAAVIEQARGRPTYLILAAAADMSLRLKPQNLVTGLPLVQPQEG